MHKDGSCKIQIARLGSWGLTRLVGICEEKNMSGIETGMSRRQLLTMIGTAAGSVVMYNAMTTLGFAQASTYTGPIKLEGDPKGASVLILGAGLAGMTAALELRDAGYKVQVLEYREKAGGRCWTLRGGDTYVELGGAVQEVKFAEGNYINPGPWRIPHHHYGVLDYCKRLGVKLEPFMQVNHNAYLHHTDAFDGKPQRFREIAADYRGHVAELLAKVVNQDALDETVSEEDAALLLESLKTYGVLDENYAYVKSDDASEHRGWEKEPGGGVDGAPIPSEPIALSEILQSRLWANLITGDSIDHQGTIFQPVGGMDMIAQGFEKVVGELITYNAKVTKIEQSDRGVAVTYVDSNGGEGEQTASADYCICTIPFSILGQIEHNFSSEMSSIIDSMHYAGSVKFGLEFKRRFWEQDERIYGGITYTNLPISQISYPSTDYFSDGPGVLLGGYSWGATAYQFNALPPEERVAKAVEYGAQIHPQYTQEFSSGVAVTWHRVPWVLGCYGIWADKEAQYATAAAMDGRTLMAGEHISYLPAWQEGAILSALDAVTRLHQHVVSA
ncbi:flavin monoamine oxidase family protein [Devosia sp. ZW T5_3]|uniref:flavin monoamine oxidase family protein n=1 Tax=Devosia sp. ZW T5_3 TaxID=3378085 RepID=UPI0038554795